MHTIQDIIDNANHNIEMAENYHAEKSEVLSACHRGLAHGAITTLNQLGYRITQDCGIFGKFKIALSFAAIFAAAATFASPATIAGWQNNLRQDAAIYRAEAADTRATAHRDRETVARKLEREAEKAEAFSAAMTDELADAYAAAAAAEDAAHRALIDWQKANTAKAADEAEKDGAAERAAAAHRKAQRRLKKAQNAALKNAAK